MPMAASFSRLDQRPGQREFAGPHRHRQHAKGDNRSRRVIEGGLAHHHLRDAVANVDLPENRHQGRRIGRRKHRAQQRRHDPRHAENEMCSRSGDRRRNHHADRGYDDDGNPNLLHHMEAQRCAAVEQDVAGAEQKQNLIERGIGLDVDQAQRRRADQHPDHKEQGNVRNFCPLRHQSGHGADGENKPGGHQRVLGDFDRGRLFQLFPPQSVPRPCGHNSPKQATVGNLAGFGLACQSKQRSSVGWSGRWESNPRHSAWEADVLPLNYARAFAQNSEALQR